MNRLKYSLSSRQTAEYLKQADEIKFEYKDRHSIPDFIEKYPEAKINLILPYTWNGEIEIDWKEIYMYAKLAKDNFILGITRGYELSQAKEKNISVYHRAHLHTFQELNDLMAAGVNEVILGAPLFFQLDKVKKRFPDIVIRATANIALPEGSLSYNDGICGIWIRPEDIPLYEQYISTIDFIADLSAEQALFRVYALQHKWPSELNFLIKDLKHPAINRMIPPTLGEARISCGQNCAINSTCHLCKRTLDLAIPDKWKQYLEKTENT